MRLGDILLLIILVVLINNSIDLEERDYKTHSDLQEIKEHLEIKKDMK